MKNKIITVITAIYLVSCSSENDFKKGKRILENSGYINIQNTGYDIFCCGEDDNFSTGFVCNDKNGNSIRGCFCSSLGKGITVRFE